MGKYYYAGLKSNYPINYGELIYGNNYNNIYRDYTTYITHGRTKYINKVEHGIFGIKKTIEEKTYESVPIICEETLDGHIICLLNNKQYQKYQEGIITPNLSVILVKPIDSSYVVNILKSLSEEDIYRCQKILEQVELKTIEGYNKYNLKQKQDEINRNNEEEFIKQFKRTYSKNY